MRNPIISSLLTISTALLIFAISSCSKTANVGADKSNSSIPDFPTSLSGLTRYYYETEMLPKFKEAYAFDRYYFFHQHLDGILKTLTVKDSILTKNIAVVFLSYKIDTTSYNDVLWFRNIDGKWWISLSQYFSEYSNDPFGDGLPEGAKEIIKRADSWRSTNHGMWWD